MGYIPAVYNIEISLWYLVLGWGFRLSLDLFPRGLHTRTAVARKLLRQLHGLSCSENPKSWLFTFFALLHITFSRTVIISRQDMTNWPITAVWWRATVTMLISGSRHVRGHVYSMEQTSVKRQLYPLHAGTAAASRAEYRPEHTVNFKTVGPATCEWTTCIKLYVVYHSEIHELRKTEVAAWVDSVQSPLLSFRLYLVQFCKDYSVTRRRLKSAHIRQVNFHIFYVALCSF